MKKSRFSQEHLGGAVDGRIRVEARAEGIAVIGETDLFTRKFQDERVGVQWFKNRFDEKIAIEDWRREYNETRSHSRLGNQMPEKFARAIDGNLCEEAIYWNRRVRKFQAGH